MAKQRQTATAAVVLSVLLAGGAPGIARAASGAIAGMERRQMDPITGLHWRWTRDSAHPEAPPRLTLVAGAGAPMAGGQVKAAMCAKSGDTMQLQTHAVRGGAMNIEVTALAGGRCGDHIPARVEVTGARVKVTLLGPGTAVLETTNEAWQ